MPDLVQLSLKPDDRDAVQLPADVQDAVVQALALLLLQIARAGRVEKEEVDNHDA